MIKTRLKSDCHKSGTYKKKGILICKLCGCICEAELEQLTNDELAEIWR